MNYYLPEQCLTFDTTLEHTHGVDGKVLMETAGRSCARVIQSVVTDKSKPFLILCGPGHNGGDGCVIARVLVDAGYRNISVIHFLNGKKNPKSSSVTYHAALLQKLNIEYTVSQIGDFDQFESKAIPGCICIDAIFGVGVRPDFDPFWLSLFDWVNQHATYTLSIDHPSGFSARDGAPVTHPHVQPNVTCSIGFPKFAHSTHYGKTACGVVHQCDAGFPKSWVDQVRPYAKGLNASTVRPLLKAPHPHDHKNKLGHVAILAGSENMPGALKMVVKAALSMGVGKVSVVGEPETLAHFQKVLEPEAMYIPLNSKIIETLKDHKVSSCVVGPGLKVSHLDQIVLNLLGQSDLPIILDAEVFYSLYAEQVIEKADKASHVAWIGHLGEQSAFFEAESPELFFSESMTIFDEWIQKLPNHVWLRKGTGSVVVSRSGRFLNESGNVGLATGGSGDVLAGMIGALAARLPLLDAVCASVFIHGHVADDLQESGAPVTPSACLAKLPSTLKKLQKE